MGKSGALFSGQRQHQVYQNKWIVGKTSVNLEVRHASPFGAAFVD